MKRKTQTETRARQAVKRLIALRAKLTKSAIDNNTDRDITYQMAKGVGGDVHRETMSRWLNWSITPRGLYLTAIEHYLDRMEA